MIWNVGQGGAFEQAAQQYADFYLQHMSMEEKQVLPLAERVLLAQDWVELDAAFIANRDPLTGHEPEDDYRALFMADLVLRVGHVGVYCDGPMLMNENKLVCRALDNRLSGFVLSEIAKRLCKQKKPLAWNVALVNAVQEEVGCIGAGMITYRIQPDAAICIDVTHATDSPGLDKGKFGDIKLGKGPAVIHGTANHPNLVARLEIVADKNKINLQHEAAGRRTGTDTDSIYVSRNGVASALVSLPLRYMHSPVETAALSDVEDTIKLLVELIKSLKPGDSFGHKL